jgi:hypothetical protein
MVVPFTVTVAPIIGVPSFESVIFPVITLSWACIEEPRNIQSKRIERPLTQRGNATVIVVVFWFS